MVFTACVKTWVPSTISPFHLLISLCFFRDHLDRAALRTCFSRIPPLDSPASHRWVVRPPKLTCPSPRSSLGSRLQVVRFHCRSNASLRFRGTYPASLL